MLIFYPTKIVTAEGMTVLVVPELESIIDMLTQDIANGMTVRVRSGWTYQVSLPGHNCTVSLTLSLPDEREIQLILRPYLWGALSTIMSETKAIGLVAREEFIQDGQLTKYRDTEMGLVATYLKIPKADHGLREVLPDLRAMLMTSRPDHGNLAGLVAILGEVPAEVEE